ncbi:MAG: sigma-70 family RNA polymerase sigma factor [Pyrinomonadaceae bacterium]|nr:sigma-70 family RNA polymerase sigma factor [Pyrinomonadaceae bacterium]
MTEPRRPTSNDEFPASAIELADAALIAACRKGDENAWNSLVDRYQRLIYTIPRRAGLSEEESNDVFQEVFLTLFEKLDEIEQPGRIRSWIVTTAKFKTWGIIRGRKGNHAPIDQEDAELEMEMLRDESPLADQALIELEQQHLIRTAIAGLEERCRTILSMIYLRTVAASYAEVAEAIGVGETSISPLRTRCLKKLEKILTK